MTLYRGLLSRYGIDSFDVLPDALYEQGLIQLALGWNAKDFLPEIIGFNLAYEQLPLHLLITAYELNELGIDPYYFTLHITVDNADTGHARRACQAALDASPRIDDGGEYWQRVRAGAKLGNVGISTVNIIDSFDIDAEVMQIFSRKASAGHGAHSDFCKIGGRKVNDWLENPDDVPAFLAALEQAGWILKDQEWALLRPWALYQEIVTVLPRDPRWCFASSGPGSAALFVPIFLSYLFDGGFPGEDLLGSESKLSHQLVHFP